MASRVTWLLTLSIVSTFLVLVTTGTTQNEIDPDSWDMIVTVGNVIHFWKNGTEIRNLTVLNLHRVVYALAYDSANRTLYVSDGNDIFYGSDLVDEKLHSELTFNRIDTGGKEIHSMVFDPVTKTLFWSQDGAIMKMEVAPYGIVSLPKISMLHDLGDDRPYSIALDVCRRFLYWTNQNSTANSIERSRLDGTDREQIHVINDSLTDLFGLALDHYNGKLYFVKSGVFHDSIAECNLDGTDERVFVNDNVGSARINLAVDDKAVYWPNWSSGSIYKVNKNGTELIDIMESYSQHRSNEQQLHIYTRNDLGDVDCNAVLDKTNERITTPEPLLCQCQSQVAATLEELSAKVDRLLANQNQLLRSQIGILEDARLTYTAAISRIDARKSILSDEVSEQSGLSGSHPHPEN